MIMTAPATMRKATAALRKIGTSWSSNVPSVALARSGERQPLCPVGTALHDHLRRHAGHPRPAAVGRSFERDDGELLFIDRASDALTPVPFLIASTIWYRAKQVVAFQLVRQPIPVDLWPDFRKMVPHLRIVGLVMIISAGVAFGK